MGFILPKFVNYHHSDMFGGWLDNDENGDAAMSNDIERTVPTPLLMPTHKCTPECVQCKAFEIFTPRF